MPRKLDLLDLRILDSLAIYGPRNLSNVARKLGIPNETLRKRVKRLISHFSLRFSLNIYHTNLGLKKAVVFVDSVPGWEDLVLDCLKANDFWIYVSRCYGPFEGYFAIYTVPIDHHIEFEQFLARLKETNVIRNVEIFWSTCFQTVQSRCQWFDAQRREWIFHWDEWVKEMPKEYTELPYTLVDPKDFPIMGDETDLFILKELEKDSTKDSTEIAKMLGISQQLLGYHYKKHLIPRKLIESFEVIFYQFSLEVSDMFIFIFEFDSYENLAKFANSLLDKPFVCGMGKVLDQNSLITHIYLPRPEFRRFIEALSELARHGYLQNYFYVILDLNKTSRQTISYEYFKNRKWVYDHKKPIENLRNLAKTVKRMSDLTKKYA